MEHAQRFAMVAPCGIDCGICEMHTCKDDPNMLSYFLSKGYPKEKLPCKGCRSIDGQCPVIGTTCATYSCVQKRSVTFCSECSDFPCAKLNPAADRAEILPHNTKVFNLCTIKKLGVEGFVKVSSDIKKRYYKGKMAVGQGPQVE